MTVLAANLKALERHHPSVARLLADLPALADHGVWSVAKSGHPTVRRDGVALASAFDPAAEAVRAVGDAADFFVLPGLGAGYLAEAAAARHPETPLLIAEEDAHWFLEVLAYRDLSALLALPQVVLFLGEAAPLGRFLGSMACREIKTLIWRPLAEQQPAWHTAVADQVAAAQARARVNLATFRRFGALWLRNLAKNEAFAREVRPLSALAGRWKGVPAVIAAAGPSLSDAFDWMRAHRQGFLLIAVDTAWPALAQHGLIPDLLVVLDGQYDNARHVDIDPPASTLVVTEWTAPPRAFRLAPGRTYVAASSVGVLRVRERALWGELGALPSGGSVATAAWSLALLAGCREVAFAGLDLGYPQGQTHVPGSQFEEAVHRRSTRLRPAETSGRGWGQEFTLRPALGGGLVRSDVRMDLFRDWLAASVAEHPEVRAVNLGSRGSVVPGLSAAPAGYGDRWPALVSTVPQDEALARKSPSRTSPPWQALNEVLGATDFPAAVEKAWAAANAFWGTEVWERWAGRALLTWKRFPSSRSRKAVEEVVQAALTWKGFWELP